MDRLLGVTWVDLGQFIAIGEDGEVIGSADPEYAEHTWKGTISNGMFTDCNPKGDSQYEADISTRPAYGHEGIGSMLYGARKELVLMRRMISGWRLFNCQDYADKMSASEYADKVINGELNDPVIEWVNPLFRY